MTEIPKDLVPAFEDALSKPIVYGHVNSVTRPVDDVMAKLNRIEAMARRHASPASNPGAHALAAAIIRICEEK